VKAGSILFTDKNNDQIAITAPVSGEVVEINRGEKRKVLDIKILADQTVEFIDFGKVSLGDLAAMPKEALLEVLLRSGAWVQLLQRPFAVLANPATSPQAIYISGFDSHPLAPDYGFTLKGSEHYFQAGITALSKLTSGKVHLTINADHEANAMYANVKGVQLNKISGPHPAGNVGVQIHHIKPLNKGDLVWTTTPLGVILIGKLLLEGKYDTSRLVALTGSELKQPQYIKLYAGASLKPIVEPAIKQSNVRIVSGNALTGEAVGIDGYLGYYHQQITVLPEGNYQEFLGWILPSTKKLSFQRAFGLLSFLNPTAKEYVLDTNTHGEERAIVQTGVFEKVLPMDIYPLQLLKAILAKDYAEMEALGIYEVAEEDFALCEFVDVSKNDIQNIVREGIELMINS
jgi:Na+-transporting NADH:ubiquinone oxidoreductase subunit A